MVSKLRKHPEQLRESNNIISLKDSILEEVSRLNKTDAAHYLPHRAAVKEERETIKTRIVFDGSATYQDKKSLNDMLDPGHCLLHAFSIFSSDFSSKRSELLQI